MIALAKKNNPSASFAVMDSRHIDELNTRFDGIVCGFCLPYLSEADCQKLIADCHQLLNEHGLLYISFVEGDPLQSGFQVTSGGDRSYFYFHRATDLSMQLTKNKFTELRTFKVEYKRSENETEIHTIVIAKKVTI